MKKLLKDAINEPNAVKKGKNFELFLESLVLQEQGFLCIRKHCRSRAGEMDYFYRSEHRDHPLWEKYPFLFVECKNWREKISSEKMNHYIKLLEAKNTFPCCGVYITTSSLSPEATEAMNRAIGNGLLIILIDKRDLHRLIDRGFKMFLQDKCEEILAKT